MKSTRPENMRKWIDALRSGNYKQGLHQLKSTDGAYCCLGVACKVSGLPFASTASVMPRTVQYWCGLEENNPMLKTPHGLVQAVRANDGLRMSFDEIADALEKTYL